MLGRVRVRVKVKVSEVRDVPLYRARTPVCVCMYFPPGMGEL